MATINGKKTDQEPYQYLVVRVQLVEAKTRIPGSDFLGFKDETYSSRAYIPNQRKDAYEIYEAVDKLIRKMIPGHISIDTHEERRLDA